MKRKKSEELLSSIKTPRLDNKSEANTVEQLLHLVVKREQDQAETMIKRNLHLLLSAGIVTDLSGREFKQITAFQYALWALDWHFWKMILKYLPSKSAMQQLMDLEAKGTEHGKHFNLEPLIQALQMHRNSDTRWPWGLHGSGAHWRKEVGKAQRQLPVHVINEYCRDDRPFHPCPEFKEGVLPRSRTVHLWNDEQCGYVKGEWFTAQYEGGSLGSSFAILRGDQLYRAGAWKNPSNSELIVLDIQALQALWKTRTQQLELLSYNLKQKSLATAALQTIGLFAEGVRLVCDYAESAADDALLKNSSPAY